MLTRNDILGSLMMGGFYRGQWWPMDDVRYNPVSPRFVAEAWQEWVRSLPPELIERRDIGGGKTIAAPRWIEEVWDCDNHTRDFGVFLSRCMAVDAAQSRMPRGNVAAGLIKIELHVAHAATWFVDHEQKAHAFDAATGEMDPFTESQLKMIFEGESL